VLEASRIVLVAAWLLLASDRPHSECYRIALIARSIVLVAVASNLRLKIFANYFWHTVRVPPSSVERSPRMTARTYAVSSALERRPGTARSLEGRTVI